MSAAPLEGAAIVKTVKPIRIGYSGLTNRIFALRRYTERPDGMIISSAKDEVTAEAVHAVLEHVQADSVCLTVGCECVRLAVLRSAGTR